MVRSAADEACELDVGEIGGVSVEYLPFRGRFGQLRFENIQSGEVLCRHCWQVSKNGSLRAIARLVLQPSTPPWLTRALGSATRNGSDPIGV